MAADSVVARAVVAGRAGAPGSVGQGSVTEDPVALGLMVLGRDCGLTRVDLR